MSYISTFNLVLHLVGQLNLRYPGRKGERLSPSYFLQHNDKLREMVDGLTPQRLKEGVAWMNNHMGDLFTWRDVEGESIAPNTLEEIPQWGTHRSFFRVERGQSKVFAELEVSEAEDARLHLHRLSFYCGGIASIRIHRAVNAQLNLEGFHLSTTMRLLSVQQKAAIAGTIQSLEQLHWENDSGVKFDEPSQDLINLLIYSMRND